MSGLGGWRGGSQKGDTTAARSANHVLVPLVQPHLAEGPAAHHHVDGRGDEAVIGDLLVQGVHLLRRRLAVGEDREINHNCTKTSLFIYCSNMEPFYTYSSKRSLSVNGTSSMRTAEWMLKKIPNRTWKIKAFSCVRDEEQRNVSGWWKGYNPL